MTAFSEANLELVVANCRDKLPAVAESLRLNIDFSSTLECGGQQAWDAEALPESMDGPGLLVVIEAAGQALVCLVPAALPLPDWYASPGTSESARLQTIAMEWGLSLLPEDIEPDRTEAIAVENLRECLVESSPAEGAVVVDWRVAAGAGDDAAESEAAAEPVEEEDTPEADAGADTSDQELPAIFVVLPVEKPPVAPARSDDDSAEPAASGQTRRLPGYDRLLPLPVTVSVRLAEKRIEMGNLLNLAPGVLIKFNKPCDDYLELYVNNFRFCRGEAIKIGEKFGLKISDVGVFEGREERILES